MCTCPRRPDDHHVPSRCHTATRHVTTVSAVLSNEYAARAGSARLGLDRDPVGHLLHDDQDTAATL